MKKKEKKRKEKKTVFNSLISIESGTSSRFGPLNNLGSTMATTVHGGNGIKLHESNCALEVGITGNLSRYLPCCGSNESGREGK